MPKTYITSSKEASWLLFKRSIASSEKIYRFFHFSISKSNQFVIDVTFSSSYNCFSHLDTLGVVVNVSVQKKRIDNF